MEAYPKTPLIWQAFTKWHAIRVDRSALAFGLGGGCSTLQGVVTAISMPYNVSRFLGINLMDAYDVYQ